MDNKEYFDKINGYYVKDSEAREDISALDSQINTANTGLAARVDALETNKSIKENIMTVFSHDDIQVTTTEDQSNDIIIFPTVLSSIGDKLSYDSTTGKITIGAGVSYVLVTCGTSITLTSEGQTYQALEIYKNNSGYGVWCQSRVANYSNGNHMPVSLCNILMPVQQGDTISAVIFNRLAGSYELTFPYLTVQVVK